MKTPRKKPKPRLRPREKALLKGVIAGKTVTQAAIEAGYSQKCPRQAGHQAMQTIEKKAPDLFARHGLDDDSFINKYLLPALNAKETRVFNADGQIIYSKPLVAWGPRVEMNKLVARMKGMIREDNAPQTSVKVVVINAEHRPPREVSVEAVSST